MGLESVEGLGIHVILAKLEARDAAAVAGVSKRFKEWASDDFLWSKFCAQELQLSSPEDPLGKPSPSFKAAYQSWRKDFGMYPWPLVGRVKSCWDRIRSWLALNFPEALATLREGASEDDIEQFEKSLNVKLPLPTRLLFRFCDGQELTSVGSSYGLIGGYSFYEDCLVNVFLLPLKQVSSETKDITRHLQFSAALSKYVVVAASSTFNEKIFFLNCSDGQLYVGTRNLSTHEEMLPCVPNGLTSAVHDEDYKQDAMLLWLEEHVRRLETGVIKLREKQNVRSISLFPEQLPACSTAVTNGVRARASAVFVPELSDLQSVSDKYFFAYSIRLSVVPEGCFILGIPFSSCQLYWRHWKIRANGNVVSDVNGEAVVGKFPLLRPGEEEFVYESCVSIASSQGTVQGSFTFIPGSLADPKGSQFEAEVAQFPLQFPDYIY